MFNQNLHAASPCYPCGCMFEPIGIGTTLRSKFSIRGCEIFGLYPRTTRLKSENISIVDSRLRSHISGTGRLWRIATYRGVLGHQRGISFSACNLRTIILI